MDRDSISYLLTHTCHHLSTIFLLSRRQHLLDVYNNVVIGGGRFFINIIMTDPEEYLYELSKFVDSKSLLIITSGGELSRIYCPFPVILIIEVEELFVGDTYLVDAVKVAPSLDDVYIISGKAYLIWYFKIQ